MTPLDTAVRAHVERFNDAVRTGDWSVFTATFAVDATMVVVGVPVGPFLGRTAIAGAYRRQPPTDTITVISIEETGPHAALIRFRWDTGDAGTMTVSFAGGEVETLTVEFDD
jgi:steroid delta-isomerase